MRRISVGGEELWTVSNETRSGAGRNASAFARGWLAASARTAWRSGVRSWSCACGEGVAAEGQHVRAVAAKP